jgi:8-oxo-dGTP pyrophosphatase MutT (NUDIX family)
MTLVTDYTTPQGVPIEIHRNRFLAVKFDGRHHFVEYNRYKSGVVIVPTYANGDFQMVKLHRAPVFGVSLEFPRGGVEPGERAEDAAKRELLEETGFLSATSSLRYLGQIGGDTATINSLCDVFSVQIDCDAPAAPFDDVEIDTPIRIPAENLARAIRAGYVRDGYTLGALTLVRVMSAATA